MPRRKSARDAGRAIRHTAAARAAVAEVATLLTARDEIDRTRTASPLYAAPDAVVIDTTGKSVQQVVKR